MTGCGSDSISCRVSGWYRADGARSPASMAFRSLPAENARPAPRRTTAATVSVTRRQLLEVGAQLDEQRRAEGVEDLGSLQRERRHGVLVVPGHEFGHDALLPVGVRADPNGRPPARAALHPTGSVRRRQRLGALHG